MRRLIGIVVLMAVPGLVLGQPSADPLNSSRQVEVQVELAWLADPLICPYCPAAHVVGQSLEVSGYVPSEEVAARVVEVARRNCALPLMNALRIRAGLSAARVSVPAERLQQAARRTACAELSGPADQVQVSCSPSGLIAVIGRVPSLQEKLRLSQALCRLPGCSAVVNLLRVEPEASTELPVLLGPHLDLPQPPPSESAWRAAPTVPLGEPYISEGDVTLLPADP
jgi:hypothetical protein